MWLFHSSHAPWDWPLHDSRAMAHPHLAQGMSGAHVHESSAEFMNFSKQPVALWNTQPFFIHFLSYQMKIGKEQPFSLHRAISD